MFRRLLSIGAFPCLIMDVREEEELLEGSHWRGLQDPGPGLNPPRRAQGTRRQPVKLIWWYGEGEGVYHHRNCEEEKNEGKEEEQPSLTTAEF